MIANQIVGFLGGAGAAAVGDYQSISTVTVGAGGQATISFTSIPSTYSHPQIRYLAHITGTGADYANINIRLNSDTAANYTYHRLQGNGTAASANAGTSQTAMLGTLIPDDLSNANTYGAGVLDLLDYTSTNKNKTIRLLGGMDNTSSYFIQLISGLWFKTPEAVTQIDLTCSANFKQYSSFALYGIK